jgi:hypothetical protein
MHLYAQELDYHRDFFLKFLYYSWGVKVRPFAYILLCVELNFTACHPAQLVQLDTFREVRETAPRNGFQFSLLSKLHVRTHLETKHSFRKG